MSAMASQITSLTIVYSTVYSGADKRKHQSSASLAFVRRNHQWPVNSPYKWPVTRRMFPFDDVITTNKIREVKITWKLKLKGGVEYYHINVSQNLFLISYRSTQITSLWRLSHPKMIGEVPTGMTGHVRQNGPRMMSKVPAMNVRNQTRQRMRMWMVSSGRRSLRRSELACPIFDPFELNDDDDIIEYHGLGQNYFSQFAQHLSKSNNDYVDEIFNILITWNNVNTNYFFLLLAISYASQLTG